MSVIFLQVASSKDAAGKVIPIPILSARFSRGRKVHLVHGSHTKPAFETLEYDKLEKSQTLVRDVESAPLAKDYGIKFMVG